MNAFKLCTSTLTATGALLFAACQTTPLQAVAAEPASSETKKAAEEDMFTPPTIDYEEADPVLGFVDARKMTSLNGQWSAIIDPMGVGDPGGFFGGFVEARTPANDMELIEYNFDTAQKLSVPGDFNTQDERLFFYQGRVWYSRKFDVTAAPGEKVHLWFGGANFKTTVYLNGEAVGQHEGGYVPFSFDVTDKLKAGTNTIVVGTDNRLGVDTVPTLRTDWWPYGGLTRDVALVHTPEAFIRNANIQLENLDARTLEARFETEGLASGTDVTVEIPELGVSAGGEVGADGTATVTFNAPVELWSPDSPRLYDVKFTAGADVLDDRVGFRTIETRGSTILLNGAPIKLRGISTHEEAIGRDGAAYSREDVRGLLLEAKALNANFVRAAHYPYSRYMSQVADELGVMLWEEVPVYWNIAWENDGTLQVAKDQVERLVERDWNRASVVIWSVANETPYSEPRMKFLGELISDIRVMDDSRLVSAALLGGGRKSFSEIVTHLAARGLEKGGLSEKDEAIFKSILEKAGDAAPGPNDTYTVVIDDPLGELVDIVAYNEYYGWYYSKFFADQTGIGEDVLRPLMLDLMRNMTITASTDKPVHISEFGAGAKAGRGGDGIWSENYQARVYEAQLAMLAQSPQVQGMTPWILKDFRAMLRPLAGIQDYRNRKGLIDENGQRKKAFTVLQDFYAGEWAVNAEDAGE